MTDDEAVAALLALGGFVWATEEGPMGRRGSIWAEADNDNGYRVSLSSTLPGTMVTYEAVHWHRHKGRMSAEFCLSSQTEAKNACEHHHRTGKWE